MGHSLVTSPCNQLSCGNICEGFVPASFLVCSLRSWRSFWRAKAKFVRGKAARVWGGRVFCLRAPPATQATLCSFTWLPCVHTGYLVFICDWLVCHRIVDDKGGSRARCPYALCRTLSRDLVSGKNRSQGCLLIEFLSHPKAKKILLRVSIRRMSVFFLRCCPCGLVPSRLL